MGSLEYFPPKNNSMKHNILIIALISLFVSTSCSLFDLADVEGKTYESDINLFTTSGCRGGMSHKTGHYTITFTDDKTCVLNAHYSSIHYSFSGEQVDTVISDTSLICNYSTSLFDITIDEVRDFFRAPCFGEPLDSPHAQKFKYVDKNTISTIGFDWESLSDINKPKFTFTLVQ